MGNPSKTLGRWRDRSDITTEDSNGAPGVSYRVADRIPKKNRIVADPAGPFAFNRRAIELPGIIFGGLTRNLAALGRGYPTPGHSCVRGGGGTQSGCNGSGVLPTPRGPRVTRAESISVWAVFCNKFGTPSKWDRAFQDIQSPPKSTTFYKGIEVVYSLIQDEPPKTGDEPSSLLSRPAWRASEVWLEFKSQALPYPTFSTVRLLDYLRRLPDPGRQCQSAEVVPHPPRRGLIVPVACRHHRETGHCCERVGGRVPLLVNSPHPHSRLAVFLGPKMPLCSAA
ncbi:hypothetical protein Bbelb_406140 [Branchiostoma belcheri]|nr:hypothetical protein Bbelb_406140 [Branchiostoma belcheri]